MNNNILLYQCPRCQSSGLIEQSDIDANICSSCDGTGFFFDINLYILKPELFPIFNSRRILDSIQNVYYLTDMGETKFLCSYNDFISNSNIIPDKENFCPYSFYSMINASSKNPLQKCDTSTCLTHSFQNCKHYKKKENCWKLYLSAKGHLFN